MENNPIQNASPNPLQSLQPIESSKKSSPFKWLSLGAGLILIIIILGGAYFLGKNPASLKNQELGTKITSPTPTPDETANWETYVNSDSNWQINYPKDLKILERDATHIGPTGLGRIIIFSKLGLTQTEGTELHDGIAFTVGLAKKDSNQSIRDFADQQTKPDENINSTRTPLKEIIINGHKGIETTVSGLGTFRTIYLEYPVLKDRVYFISILSEGPQKEIFDKTTQSMLNSFKSYK